MTNARHVAEKPAVNTDRSRAKKKVAATYVRRLTLGELIAATFDVVGNEVRSASRLLSSSDMQRLTGRKIICV